MGRHLRALLALAVALAVAGCTGVSPEPARVEQSRTDLLWSARTPYLGDNSAVLALLREVRRDPAGQYTVSLQTSSRPYALSIEEQAPDDPLTAASAREQATLMLGLVANLDEVRITSKGRTRSLTAEAASTRLGFDVKQLGRDRGRLTTYLTRRNG